MISPRYQAKTFSDRRPPRSRSGKTLVELLFAIVIILVIMSLLIGGVRMATRSGKAATHLAAVSSLKQGVSTFQQEFGFVPPLVFDLGPPPGFNGDPIYQVGGEWRVRTLALGTPGHADFIRTAPQPVFQIPDRRFSIYALPYYLVGVLDQPRNATVTNSPALDGVAGPGFRTPTRDGTFSDSGRIYQPFFAVGSGSTTVFPTNADEGRIELRDGNGIAFRYYRWEPNPNAPQNATVRERLGIPVMVARLLPNDTPWDDFPSEVAEAPAPAIANARYAIIGAGLDGLFGDEFLLDTDHPQYVPLLAMQRRLGVSDPDGGGADALKAAVMRKAMEDNVMEVGR
jgi:type II secretory pathway pseudopilin PulG